MKMIVTGGGTGGHIYPGISIAKAFQKKESDNEIVFVGTNRGMEAEIVPKEGFQFYALKVKGIQRKICLENIYALLLFFASLIDSYKVIKKIKPDLVIGTGGYVSGSVALVSSLMGIPTYLHEQNAIPGITNQFLSLTCRRVFLSFPETKYHFWRKNKTIHLGNPVRKEVWEGNKHELIQGTNLVEDKKTILVFGGSKGASAINQTFLNCLEFINEGVWDHWQVLMIAGKDDYFSVKEKIDHSRHKNVIHVLSYLYRMGNAYDLANLAICRAGATTVAELTAKGLPSILIPYPYATGNHQFYNARFLEKNHAAILIPESELSEQKLAGELSRLLDNQEEIDRLASNSRNMGNRNADEAIIETIYRDLKKEA